MYDMIKKNENDVNFLDTHIRYYGNETKNTKKLQKNTGFTFKILFPVLYFILFLGGGGYPLDLVK